MDRGGTQKPLKDSKASPAEAPCAAAWHTQSPKYPTNEVNKDNRLHTSDTDTSHFLPFLLRWMM